MRESIESSHAPRHSLSRLRSLPADCTRPPPPDASPRNPSCQKSCAHRKTHTLGQRRKARTAHCALRTAHTDPALQRTGLGSVYGSSSSLEVLTLGDGGASLMPETEPRPTDEDRRVSRGVRGVRGGLG